MENDNSIELCVRRILSEGELEVRRSISDEVAEHRTFLQNQFKTLTLGLGLLFAVAGGIFIFLFGESFDSAKEQIIQEVDSKVIEYRIIDAYKDRLEDQVQLVVDGEFTRNKIENIIKESASDYVESNIAKIIENKVSEQIGELEKENIKELLQRITKESISINELANRLEKQNYILKRNMDEFEEGLLANQKDIKSELRQLMSETESEISKIRRELREIRIKTDAFNVRKSGNSLLFVPNTEAKN